MVKHEVLGRIFSNFRIFCENLKLNSIFQPAKTDFFKTIFVQKLLPVKDAPSLITG